MKRRESRYDYGACHACGGRMEERRIKQHFWSKRGLVVIEDFPAGVCRRCGEKVVKADVGRAVAELVAGSRRLRKTRTMSVPVIKFVDNVA